MDLGQKVFYLEAKTKDITEGILVGNHISESGYWICQIFNQELNKKLSIEKAHVHETKEFAEHHRDTVSTFIDEAQAKADEANKYVDEKREMVIGKAVFKELAERINNPTKNPLKYNLEYKVHGDEAKLKIKE